MLRVLFFFCAFFLSAIVFTKAVGASEFVVTSASDFNTGVSSGTTVADVGLPAGGGDGSVVNTLGSEVIDQSQGVGSTTQTFDNTKWVSQTFTSGKTGFLSKVTLSVDRNNSVSTDGLVTLELRSTSSGVPSSAILATSAVSASTLGQSAQADVDFDFPSIIVDSGTVYALVLYRSGFGTITADYRWYRGEAGLGNDQYAFGGRYTSSDSGGSWTIQTTANPGTGDLRFSTFVRQYLAVGTQDSEVFDSGSANSQYNQISWSEDLASGTDITFEVRASDTIFAKGDASPAWTSLGSGDSPIDLTRFLTGTFRYFQWRAALSGTSTVTPILNDVTVSYAVLPAIFNVQSRTPSPTTALVSWETDISSTSRVIYDVVSHSSLGEAPNYGYAFSTFLDSQVVTSRSVHIDGLSDGTVYYYRVVSDGALGLERTFKTLTYAGAPIVSGEVELAPVANEVEPVVPAFVHEYVFLEKGVLGDVPERDVDEEVLGESAFPSEDLGDDGVGKDVVLGVNRWWFVGAGVLLFVLILVFVFAR